MNFILECDVTLSKKMEKICENGEPVSINITGIRGNKGQGVMRITSPSGVTIEDLAGIGETSLMLKVTNITDDIASLATQQPQAQIFGSERTNMPEPPAIKKIAKTDSKIPQGDPHPLSVNSVGRPTQQKKASAKSIMDFDELTDALLKVPGIENPDPPAVPEGQRLSRPEAIKFEMSVPRLSTGAYVRSKIQSKLLVDDIGITFLPMGACDLSRYPAKKLLASADLRWCIENDKIEFISMDEYLAWFDEASKIETVSHTLEVYGGSRGSARAIRSEIESGKRSLGKEDVVDEDAPSEFRDSKTAKLAQPVSRRKANNGDEFGDFTVTEADLETPPPALEDDPGMQSLISTIPE